MISLSNKVAIVTGGSRGIGRAIVLMLAKAGCHVAINYREDIKSAEGVKKEVESLGIKANIYQADVADKSQVDGMVNQVVTDFNQIDIVINNAGIWINNPIDSMTEDRLKQTLEVNLFGSFYPVMAAVPYMKKQKSGNIIFISSTAGQRGEAFYSPYAATKGAIISLTKSLAVELADFNIRVNCVAPGWVDTDMTKPTMNNSSEVEKVHATIPLKRIGRPDELAGPVLFLASELSSFITGEILNVNGGAVLCG